MYIDAKLRVEKPSQADQSLGVDQPRFEAAWGLYSQ